MPSTTPQHQGPRRVRHEELLHRAGRREPVADEEGLVDRRGQPLEALAQAVEVQWRRRRMAGIVLVPVEENAHQHAVGVRRQSGQAVRRVDAGADPAEQVGAVRSGRQRSIPEGEGAADLAERDRPAGAGPEIEADRRGGAEA